MLNSPFKNRSAQHKKIAHVLLTNILKIIHVGSFQIFDDVICLDIAFSFTAATYLKVLSCQSPVLAIFVALCGRTDRKCLSREMKDKILGHSVGARTIEAEMDST